MQIPEMDNEAKSVLFIHLGLFDHYRIVIFFKENN